MKKLFCLTLALLMCLAVFASCSKDEPAGKEFTTTAPAPAPEPTPEPTPTPTPDEFTGIKVDMLSQYAVVYPENAADEIAEAAKGIAKALNDKFGTAVTQKNDYVVDLPNSTQKVGEFEILVGSTNRDETAEYAKTLGYRQYGFALIGKKLVIAGYSDAETLLAIDKFVNEYIANAVADEEMFFEDGDKQSFKVESQNNHADITIGGVSISEYRIVYPTDAKLEKALATRIAKTLAADCAILPEVVADSEAYADGYEILVGKTNRTYTLPTDMSAGTGYVGTTGKLVALAGDTAWGTTVAVNTFVSYYEDAPKSDVLALTLANAGVADTATNPKVMSFDIDGATAARAEAVVGAILAQMPDIISLQGVDEAADAAVVDVLESYYTVAGTGEAIILFATEKYTNTASATENGYTYLTATRTSDNLALTVLNTVLDKDSVVARTEQVKKILEFYNANKTDKAVIVTGDLACTTAAVEYKLLIGTDLANASFLAATATNVNVGSKNYILADDHYIDVVTFDGGTASMYGETLTGGAPAVVELTVNMTGTDKKTEPAYTLNFGFDADGDKFDAPTLVG